jgi:pilus assembly protein Flp/PilA
MLDTVKSLIALKNDRRGVTAIEYGLIAALMSAVLVTIFTTLGTNLTTAFTAIGATLVKAQ